MTIIHSYRNNRRRPIIFHSSKNYPRKNRWFWRNYFDYFQEMALKNGYLGYIKVFALNFTLIGVIIFSWLIIFGANISFDYQIYSLKKEINKIEEKISVLQEKTLKVSSREALEKWAEENGFVEVKNISYINLSEGSLAQLKPLNF